MRILYLFPDTNLFLQCKALSQLKWSDWSDFEEINLVISRPVQREIDQQKNRGNDRVGKRARATSSIFGEVVRNDEGFVVVSSREVIVKLFLEAAKLPDQSLKDRLDYNKSDDEIVGCLSRFRIENPGTDARLLSNDNGAMATAKALNLPYSPIPSDWLLPAEETDAEKEINRLQRELTEHSSRSPRFEIKGYGMDGSEIPVLTGDFRLYQPLTYDEITQIMSDLESNFSRDQEWLTSCVKMLLKLHEALQRSQSSPRIRFEFDNRGSSPAESALVEVVATGSFLLIPPLEDVPKWMQKRNSDALRFPSIPAPRQPSPLGLSALSIPPPALPPMPPDLFVTPRDTPNRENDELEYRHGVPESPLDSLRLDCDQWRHGSGPKNVSLCIWPDSSETAVTGSIELTLHAANLTEPVKKTVGVNLKASKGDTMEFAQKLVGNL